MTNEIMSAVLSLFLTGGGENALLKVTAVDDAGCAISNAEVTVSALCKYYFVEPECRIYGICGFSVRKRGVESKKSLTARIVCIGANENVISDEIKKIENIKSGTCGD